MSENVYKLKERLVLNIPKLNVGSVKYVYSLSIFMFIFTFICHLYVYIYIYVLSEDGLG